MDQYVYSQGNMKTSVNNNLIDNKSYEFTYDGNIGKGLIKNNEDSYYVELDNDDFKKIFKKDKKDGLKIETKLKNLLNSKSKSKSKSKSIKTKTTKTKSQKPNSQKKTKKNISKSSQNKRKSKTKKKSKKSKRKTKKMPLETNFLNTLV